ncbi:hypothetical protein LCGC14_1477040 [marine sediment metagenome]|uniref:Uncharacterized protein n=1 Tax=marine sediment metagenome TaxID=412755 RepID=A0A0F9JWP8_9ZZZZ
MPLYDYECCGRIELDVYAEVENRVRICSRCNSELRPAIRAAADHTFQETFFEHLGEKGTTISTRRQLKEESARQDKYSMLLDG